VAAVASALEQITPAERDQLSKIFETPKSFEQRFDVENKSNEEVRGILSFLSFIIY
jgi:hypothetical protein